MAMTITGTPGAPSASIPPGSQPQAGFRMINTQDMAVSEVHGRYYESTYRGGRYAGAMQAVIATALQTGLTASLTGGLVLYNPNGSGVNAVLEKVGYATNIIAQSSAGIVGIGVGQSTTAMGGTLTSVNPKSRKLGSGLTPVCGLVSSATITAPVAPTLDTILTGVDTGAITVGFNNGGNFDFEGGLLLPPGAFACFVASAGLVASSYMFSMQWEEVPV